MDEQNGKNDNDYSTINKSCHPDCTKSDNICPRTSKSNDRPTKFAGLGFRALYTVISWFLLLKSSDGFFAALAMMSIPLVKEYFAYVPNGKGRKIIWGISITAVSINLLVALLGLFGILSITEVYIGTGLPTVSYVVITENAVLASNMAVPLSCVWFLSMSLAVLTIVDFLIDRTAEEVMVTETPRVISS